MKSFNNSIIYPSINHSLKYFKGSLQSISIDMGKWEYFVKIFRPEHEIICKNFGFKYSYFTGKNYYKRVEKYSSLNCKENETDIHKCEIKYMKKR